MKVNLKKVCLKKVGLYEVVGCNKDGGVYTVHSNYHLINEAKHCAKELAILTRGNNHNECIKVVQHNNHNVVYWSFSDNNSTIDLKKY